MIIRIKRIMLAIIITIDCMMFLGCKESFIAFEPSQYDRDNMNLYTIAAFSIPYADKMGTKIISVEEDSFGRVLFRVEFGSSLFYHRRAYAKEDLYMYAFVICQKSDQDKTYYYEDDCFRIYPDKDAFTENEQRELKEVNDWNLPLIDEKMTARTIITSGDSKLSSTALGLKNGLSIRMRLEDLFFENSSINKECIFSEYLDCDKNGRSIGIIWGYTPAEIEMPEIEAYFIMVEKDCLTTHKATVAPIHDTLHLWSELKNYKANNSWDCLSGNGLQKYDMKG